MESPQDNDTMPLKGGFNFTPIYGWDPGVRVRMRISKSDLEKTVTPGYGFQGTITDLDTGKRFNVYVLWPVGKPRDTRIFEESIWRMD